MFVKYADDVTILHFCRNVSDDFMQNEYNHLCVWANNHGMLLNASKTKVLDIVTASRIQLSAIVDNSSGVEIQSVRSASILGVVFNINLKWNDHFTNAISKANKRIFYLIQLRRSGCSKDILLKFYSTVIRPVLSYAVSATCNAPASQFVRLSRLEKRVCKIIGCLPNPRIEDFCKCLCGNHFKSILKYESHPLRMLFEVHPVRQLRTMPELRPPLARSNRLRDSFIKYANTSTL